MDDRLSTAVDPLDDALRGGLPAGSLVAVQAPPEAQSRALLRAGRERRPTYYLTTVLSERAVEDMFEATGGGSNDTVAATGIEAPLDAAHAALEDLDEQATVVVDAANPLESRSAETDYLAFLRELAATLEETGSVGFLHCLATDPPPQHRGLSLSAAEFVWSLDVEPQSDRIDFYLEIPKARAMTPETRVLHLELGEDIRVDTSRDIA